MMDVNISGACPRSVDPAEIDRTLAETLRAARRTPAGSVSVAFISDAKMRTLNRRWRKIDRTTDVLSFASPSLPFAPRRPTRSSRPPFHWGDIFVSPTRVRSEAKRRSIAFKEELLRVLAHGMLHLLGYDHASAREETVMFGLQERAVAHVLDL